MASTARTPSLPVSGELTGPRSRARGALLGLAVGDALGAPAENLKPSEIRARWGRITGYVADRPQGTDDTEYALFSGLLLARHGSALTPAHAEAAWHEWITERATFRGAGFSERGTLENLRRGLAAPISAQHRHAWSDGLAMRAAPFGVFAAGRPGEAARLVAVDGSVSHEGEGIYGGQAVAAGVAAAMAGAAVPVVIAAALAVIPDDSWTARSLRRAVAVAHRGERAVRSAVVIGGYPWTDLAPEAVALAFGAYATADGDFREAVLTAVNMGRDADTTAAVAGALSGATQGLPAIPTAWASAIGPARGRCLPSMSGWHVLEVADLLVRKANGERAAEPPTSPPALASLRPTAIPLLTPTPQPTDPPQPTTMARPTAAPPLASASHPTNAPQPVIAAALPIAQPQSALTSPQPATAPLIAPTLPPTEPPQPVTTAALPTTQPRPVLASLQPSTTALIAPASHPTSAPQPVTTAARPTDPPPPAATPTHAPSPPLPTATRAAEPPSPPPAASPPPEPPPAPSTTPQPIAPPPPLTPASQPTDSGGGWAKEDGRGARGRSPLGGVDVGGMDVVGVDADVDSEGAP
ncbi:ADP-ribosylglycohydrolase family protein [Streptomyces sp. WP-1]|uniref:ADP-ribosylglycohydrolase family protein n=1 Tax=Streptomyces sp. WP-1 TaxID=3041497 RepID=UPI002649C253|nr:ADP-ribosylglycohydrolase family protein [Streptomyces sp. WP-1]WKE72238.1 ADP-ribosylglycohydrolase family protein [Streptomyces sp. WP-1]